MAEQDTETDPREWFEGARRVIFVHAHPDDETIATGGTLAALAEAGLEPLVVTLTRGERGEVVDGPLAPLAGSENLAPHRQAELALALGMLGVERHAFLGVAPARVEDLPPTIYEDSGMVWSSPGVASAAPDAGTDALTRVPAAESLADLLAVVGAAQVGAVVSYDSNGGYGHPDHVHAHRIARAVAYSLELPFWEIVADGTGAEPAESVEYHDVSRWHERKVAALRAHASQLTVDGAGDSIEHVGGQRQPIERVEAFRQLPSPQ